MQENLILQKKLTVNSSQVDMFRRMRLSALFSLLQEAAIEHTTLLGCGRDKTLDRGLLWIVTHQSATISRMPIYDDTIILSTWAGKTMHMFFPRYWRLQDTKGNIIVEVSSLWVLLSETDRKIIFPEEYDIQIPFVQADEQPAMPARTRMPKDFSIESDFPVPPSYVDMNGHMNNARYFDVVQDVLPFEWYKRDLKKVSMEYVNEILLGETLKIKSLLQDNDAGSEAVIIGESGAEAGKIIFRMRLECQAV